MAAQLPDLPPITRLSPRVIRILGGNPSKFTLQGTNAYLIGTGPRRILLDTGEGKPVWAETLRQVLGEESASVEIVLLSHWHPDHVGGVEDVKALETGVRVFKHLPAAESGFEGFEDGAEFGVEGARLRAVHCPGHTGDHMGFLLEEEGAMFTGDNVLGHGTAVFEDLAVYMRSLERMRGVEGLVGRGYPGHGEVLEDCKGKVGEYVEHRRLREREALGVLERPREDGSGEGWGSMEVVKVVYKGYPEALHGPAEGSLRQVLRKLEGEGRVKEVGGRWSVVEQGGKERL